MDRFQKLDFHDSRGSRNIAYEYYRGGIYEKEYKAEWEQRWLIEHPSNHAIRAYRLSRATPAWADKKSTKAIYVDAKRLSKMTGIRFVVDHIVPIKGMRVSGLHVAENLQIITGHKNAKKYNKFLIE